MTLLTEEEARGKLCCGTPELVRALLFVSPRFNAEKVYDPKTMGRCIASECMAWWRAGSRVTERFIWQNDNHAKQEAKAAGWRYVVTYDTGRERWERADESAPQVGYCGLAGGQP